MVRSVTDVVRDARKYIRRILLQSERPEFVVVTGSHARKTAVEDLSDIDLLVVGDTRLERAPAGVHVLIMKAADLERRLELGDDFAQWSLRFGKPVDRRSAWQEFAEKKLRSAPWPDPVPKYSQARKRLEWAKDLLEMDDLEAAREETRFGLAQLARARLLEDGVFPLSRPELPSQLGERGYDELSDALRSCGSASSDELKRLLHFAEAQLSART